MKGSKGRFYTGFDQNGLYTGLVLRQSVRRQSHGCRGLLLAEHGLRLGDAPLEDAHLTV